VWIGLRRRGEQLLQFCAGACGARVAVVGGLSLVCGAHLDSACPEPLLWLGRRVARRLGRCRARRHFGLRVWRDGARALFRIVRTLARRCASEALALELLAIRYELQQGGWGPRWLVRASHGIGEDRATAIWPFWPNQRPDPMGPMTSMMLSNEAHARQRRRLRRHEVPSYGFSACARGKDGVFCVSVPHVPSCHRRSLSSCVSSNISVYSWRCESHACVTSSRVICCFSMRCTRCSNSAMRSRYCVTYSSDHITHVVCHVRQALTAL